MLYPRIRCHGDNSKNRVMSGAIAYLEVVFDLIGSRAVTVIYSLRRTAGFDDPGVIFASVGLFI